MNKKEIIIGVDFGGTKILTGAITKTGKLVTTPVKAPTLGNEPGELIIERLVRTIEKTIADAGLTINDFEGIGIGATGPLDIDSGTILECPQLPTLHFFPLRKAIEDHFKVPVLVNNDANCLVLGECFFGAARNHKTVVGLTLGTGLGCAIVQDGKIYNGSTGTAAEIWPSPYRSGTIEDYISGAGVSVIYKSITGTDRSSLDIYQLALDDDPDALQTWKEFGYYLAVPLSWSINMIDPDIVVIGGSIAGAFRFFSSSMNENVRKWICPVPAQKTKIVAAELGDNAGFTGAACLFMDWM
jgi:glucokinase